MERAGRRLGLSTWVPATGGGFCKLILFLIFFFFFSCWLDRLDFHGRDFSRPPAPMIGAGANFRKRILYAINQISEDQVFAPSRYALRVGG